jgi:uncharacterized protein YdhG (YjbR/CyaY superfamily)
MCIQLLINYTCLLVNTTDMTSTLDEYVQISGQIMIIHDRINRYKNAVDNLLSCSKSDNERKEIVQEFTNSMKILKTMISKKYNLLVTRQKELKLLLIDPNSNEVNQMIDQMKNKYDNLTKKSVKINTNSLMDVRSPTKRSTEFEKILKEIQTNLSIAERIEKQD